MGNDVTPKDVSNDSFVCYQPRSNIEQEFLGEPEIEKYNKTKMWTSTSSLRWEVFFLSESAFYIKKIAMPSIYKFAPWEGL